MCFTELGRHISIEPHNVQLVLKYWRESGTKEFCGSNRFTDVVKEDEELWGFLLGGQVTGYQKREIQEAMNRVFDFAYTQMNIRPII